MPGGRRRGGGRVERRCGVMPLASLLAQHQQCTVVVVVVCQAHVWRQRCCAWPRPPPLRCTRGARRARPRQHTLACTACCHCLPWSTRAHQAAVRPPPKKGAWGAARGARALGLGAPLAPPPRRSLARSHTPFLPRPLSPLLVLLDGGGAAPGICRLGPASWRSRASFLGFLKVPKAPCSRSLPRSPLAPLPSPRFRPIFPAPAATASRARTHGPRAVTTVGGGAARGPRRAARLPRHG